MLEQAANEGGDNKWSEMDVSATLFNMLIAGRNIFRFNFHVSFKAFRMPVEELS